MNESDSRTARRIKAIEVALTGASMTANELAAAIHVVPQSALDYIRDLIDPENQRIRIVAWRRFPGHIVAVYRWGAGKNRAKPLAKTAVQCENERRQRIRKDPDAYARYLSKERARYARTKAAKKPSTWVSPLGAQL